MRKISSLALILMLVLVLPAAAGAGRSRVQDNANMLYKNCGGNVWARSYCSRYIIGLLEDAKRDGQPLPICQPKDASNGEVVDAVKAWLKNHPDERHLSAASLITRALSETWPCK